MNNYKIFFAMFVVFGLIGMIRGMDPVSSGDLFFMHVNIDNDSGEDLDDLSVKVVIYDLGIFIKTGSFDLNDREVDGKCLFWDVPLGTKPGYYLSRITVSNDDVREVKHRIITIV